MTSAPGSDIYHRAVTDSLGRLWLVWQRVASPRPRIMAKYLQGETWSSEVVVSEGPSGAATNWWPAVAAGPTGRQLLVPEVVHQDIYRHHGIDTDGIVRAALYPAT